MSVVVWGTNRFEDCQSLLAVGSHPLLKVLFDPLRVALHTPDNLPSGVVLQVDEDGGSAHGDTTIVRDSSSFSIFWRDHALVVAILVDKDAASAHLKVDLRPIGINIFDDYAGIHIGTNIFAGNVVRNAAAAIRLAS